ncbi:MAG: glycosyltransferase [Acidobacteria bacterium]|nr:MAG: glycosyltransferase [Acidobacteriota bacterium]
MRILITSWGSYGDVYPYVGLGLALRERGDRPVIATAEFYRPFIESLGFEFHPVGPMIDPNDRELIARVLDPVRGHDVLLKGILMPALRSDHAALDRAVQDVDGMVTHPITFAAPIVAQARGLPWVSTVLAPMSFFSPTDIPVLAPAPFLAPLGRLGPWYGHLMARFARHHTRAWMKPVFDLRRDLGLPPGEHPLFEGQFSPMLTLALFSRVLGEPQPDWPPNVRVTGFIFYNGPDGLSPELEAFLDAGPPPIVFTLGTSAVAAAGRFYEESIAAVRRLGVRAVLLTGGFEQNRPSGALPPGVMSARVVRLGVARSVLPRQYRGARVAKELERLLADTTVSSRAAEAAGVVRSEGGSGAAAAAIQHACATFVRGNANDSRHVSYKERLDA